MQIAVKIQWKGEALSKRKSEKLNTLTILRKDTCRIRTEKKIRKKKDSVQGIEIKETKILTSMMTHWCSSSFKRLGRGGSLITSCWRNPKKVW